MKTKKKDKYTSIYCINAKEKGTEVFLSFTNTKMDVLMRNAYCPEISSHRQRRSIVSRPVQFSISIDNPGVQVVLVLLHDLCLTQPPSLRGESILLLDSVVYLCFSGSCVVFFFRLRVVRLLVLFFVGSLQPETRSLYEWRDPPVIDVFQNFKKISATNSNTLYVVIALGGICPQDVSPAAVTTITTMKLSLKTPRRNSISTYRPSPHGP